MLMILKINPQRKMACASLESLQKSRAGLPKVNHDHDDDDDDDGLQKYIKTMMMMMLSVLFVVMMRKN